MNCKNNLDTLDKIRETSVTRTTSPVVLVTEEHWKALADFVIGVSAIVDIAPDLSDKVLTEMLSKLIQMEYDLVMADLNRFGD